MSNDQMRDNKGKAKLSYWHQTLLCLHVEEEYELDTEDGAPVMEVDHADMLIQGVTAWLTGKIEHHEMTAQWWDSACSLVLDLGLGYTQVCEFGASKYARGNFRKGQTVCHYADSMLRHLKSVRDKNELLDPESQLSHFFHAFWNWVQIFEIMEQPEVAPLRDDRLLHMGNLSGGQVPLAFPAVPAKS